MVKFMIMILAVVSAHAGESKMSPAVCKALIESGRAEYKQRIAGSERAYFPRARLIDTFFFLLDKMDREAIRAYRKGIGSKDSVRARLNKRAEEVLKLYPELSCPTTWDDGQSQGRCRMYITVSGPGEPIKVTVAGKSERYYEETDPLVALVDVKDENAQLWDSYHFALGHRAVDGLKGENYRCSDFMSEMQKAGTPMSCSALGRLDGFLRYGMRIPTECLDGRVREVLGRAQVELNLVKDVRNDGGGSGFLVFFLSGSTPTFSRSCARTLGRGFLFS